MATTLVEAREACVNLIHGPFQLIHPDVPVFWENTMRVDLDQVGTIFIRCGVDFDDAAQLTINDQPEHRTYGTFSVTVFYKEGTNNVKSLQVADTIKDLIKYKLAGDVKFWTPTPGRKDARDGWVSQDWFVTFHFDSLE